MRGLAVLCLVGLANVALSHPGIEIRIAELTERIAANPNDAVLYVRRGEQYRDHQQWDEALADFQTASALDPALATAPLIGRTLFEAGRLSSARRHLERALDSHPRDARARATLARTLAALGESHAAAAAYTLAIDDTMAPAKPAVDDYLERATCLLAADIANLDQAIQGLDAGYRRLGAIVLQLEAMKLERQYGRLDAALRRVDEIAGHANRKETWSMERGAILEEAGRTCEASAAFAQALREIAAVPLERRSAQTQQLEQQARAAVARLSPSMSSEQGGMK